MPERAGLRQEREEAGWMRDAGAAPMIDFITPQNEFWQLPVWCEAERNYSPRLASASTPLHRRARLIAMLQLGNTGAGGRVRKWPTACSCPIAATARRAKVGR